MRSCGLDTHLLKDVHINLSVAMQVLGCLLVITLLQFC